jgi:hypothetical protein
MLSSIWVPVQHVTRHEHRTELTLGFAMCRGCGSSIRSSASEHNMPQASSLYSSWAFAISTRRVLPLAICHQNLQYETWKPVASTLAALLRRWTLLSRRSLRSSRAIPDRVSLDIFLDATQLTTYKVSITHRDSTPLLDTIHLYNGEATPFLAFLQSTLQRSVLTQENT